MEKNKKEKDDEVIKLGKRIKQLRLGGGHSSYENFAYENNISRSQWGKYERGENLRFSSLVKACKALDISLEDFFSGWDDLKKE